MNITRLIVLGTLSTLGPMYGHQIQRTFSLINLEAWSEVRVGSLYHALNRLHEQELIEPVRTEREGRLPARTVFAITPEGERELAVLRDHALRTITRSRDPFDVGLWVATGLPHDELEATVRRRLDGFRSDLAEAVQLRLRLGENQQLPAVGRLLMRHSETRLEAEIAWHTELIEHLDTIVGEGEVGVGIAGPWPISGASDTG